MKKRTILGILFDIANHAFLIGIFIVTFYPFWYVFIVSLNDGTDTMKGGLFLLPRVLTLESYKTVLSDREIMSSALITIARTVTGTFVGLACTTMLAYSLSRRDLAGRKFFNLLFIFTMYFGGGLIPYYMILKSLGLIDNFLVFILPSAISVFNMIIVRTFIESLPFEFTECATIDGANDFKIFIKIILPLCSPVLATVGLFIGIFHWNSWFDSYVFTYKLSLKTLPAVLVKILNQYQSAAFASVTQQLADSQTRKPVSTESIRMTTTMVATIPIIFSYPFVQKYFVKGILFGAIKG